MNNAVSTSRHGAGSRVASVFLSAAMLASSFLGLGSALTVATTTEAAAAGNYGLASKIEDGNILHCFDWKISDITAALPKIAEAGFTSVQTSPVQPHDANGQWYWLYQPLEFKVGNDICSEQDLKTLCSTADQYGIKVVVDVVANHLAGWADGRRKDYIQSDLNKDEFFHNTQYNTDANNVDWGNRWQITHCNIGMPDLNSEHSYVQQVVAGFVNQLKADGVDGIRWDAAKHIGVPSEDCQFWPAVTKAGLYNYGEILDSPGGDGATIMKEYTNYIGITDSGFSGTVTGDLRDGKVTQNMGGWGSQGVPMNRIVYWPESHDTFCNDGWTRFIDESIMDKAFAVFGARANCQTLYLSRPYEKEHKKIMYGVKGSEHFTSKQVAAVNHFHNAMVGTKEYYTTGDGCDVVCRGGGAVIVNASGGSKSVTVPNGGGTVPAGTYKDEITGNTWTVTSSTISGTIGDTGIAVVYNGGTVTHGAQVSATPGSSTFATTVTATLNVSNASSGTYTTSDGQSGTYTNGKSITFGSSTAIGGKVTLTLSAKGEDGVTVTQTYTYTKKDPNAVTAVYFDNTSYKWSSVYAYIYGDGTGGTISGGESGLHFKDTANWGTVYAYFFAGTSDVGAKWPGTAMTKGSSDYYIEVPSGATHVVFNNGGNGSQTGNLPVAGVYGYTADGGTYSSTGSGAATVTENAKWPGVQMTKDSATGYYYVEVPDALVNGKVIFAESSTATTNRYPADQKPGLDIGGTSKILKANYAWEDYSGGTVIVEPKDPTVTSNKASGTDFTTETLDITLTLANAASGTYSVDGGPVKTFTGSKTVKIGEGKIGDSVVTVAATAKGSDGTTKNYTFTYNKKYVKKTTGSSASAIGGKYATNPSGKGTKKTITSASDWTANELIAQGVANDDANIFKGPHEYPIYDDYALFAAWDDTNLYIGWQYVEVRDVTASDQNGMNTNETKPYNADIPQMLVLDLGKNKGATGAMDTADTDRVWGIDVSYAVNVDAIMCFSSKPTNGTPALFTPDSNGKFSYNKTNCRDFKSLGITLKYEDGLFGGITSLTGINGNAYTGYKPDDLWSASSAWTDLSSGHKSSLDTFYTMTIPLSALDITRSDIETNGVGVMHISTYGLSGIGCIPQDKTMYDTATDGYSADNSSTKEKEDADTITVPLARVGAGSVSGGGTGGGGTGGDTTLPLQVNFGTDKSAPQLTTTSMTIKGIGYGGTAPYKYQFSVDGTVVKATSTADTYTWKPNTNGSHTLKCVITDSAGKTATATKAFTAEGENQGGETTALTNKSTIASTSVPKDTSVTVTGAASGGTSPYKYAFYYKKTTSSAWTSIGEVYGNTTQVSFVPASIAKYYVKINVKDGTGKVVTKQYTLNSVKPTSSDLQNTSTLSLNSITKGTPIKITGKATGGSGSYKYGFYYKKTTSKAFTTIGTEYGSATTATFTPASDADYNIRINVKDSSGTIVTKQYKVLKAGSSSSTTALTNNSKISSASVTVGSSVTLTGAASGGTSPYKYAFYYKKTTSSSYTTIGTAFGSATTATFKPGSAANYDVKITVKDNTGKTVDKSFVVKASASSSTSTLANNSKVSAVKVTKGTTVTITGAASGGTSPYKYSYYYKKSTSSSYNTISSNTSSTSATFTPGVAATYDVKVVVTDSTGATATKTFSVISQ